MGTLLKRSLKQNKLITAKKTNNPIQHNWDNQWFGSKEAKEDKELKR